MDVKSHFRFKERVARHCIKTNPGLGLTGEDTAAAINILNGPAPDIPAPAALHQASENRLPGKKSDLLPGNPENTPEARAQFVKDCARILERRTGATASLGQCRTAPVLSSARSLIRVATPFTGKIIEKFDGEVAQAKETEGRIGQGWGATPGLTMPCHEGKSKRVSRFKARRMKV
mmetsp:Transcript_16117/g.22507  ORF Transcript_16117/g.22507 Transcript_16117/m.22507 type:complete len:176 (+) Transcript_16117:470-997(+)